MQEERLRLRGLRVGALPILNRFIERMGLMKAIAAERALSACTRAAFDGAKPKLFNASRVNAFVQSVGITQPGANDDGQAYTPHFDR